MFLGAEPGKLPYRFAPSGLPGEISDAAIEPAPELLPLPAGFRSPDIDLSMMARWFLRHLNKNPRPELNYEPVFFVRPLEVPPAPQGHDAIVPGDTDARMDWEYRNMREILGLKESGPVENGLHARVLGYLREDGLAWVPPGHYMEGDVYSGKKVGPEKLASTWATAKILRSLSEEYKRSHRAQDRQMARRSFLALQKLAEWDTGRAYYPGGSGAWLDGKWVKPQLPTAAVEPIVSYWEATGDAEALSFARAVADGLLADSELLPKTNARILPDGEFHGHMHSTLHGVWGVAHLGAVLKEPRYVEWAKNVYDYAHRFGPGTGWMQAALWSDGVRELSETCATSDMVSIASWIARAGLSAVLGPRGASAAELHPAAAVFRDAAVRGALSQGKRRQKRGGNRGRPGANAGPAGRRHGRSRTERLDQLGGFGKAVRAVQDALWVHGDVRLLRARKECALSTPRGPESSRRGRRTPST